MRNTNEWSWWWWSMFHPFCMNIWLHSAPFVFFFGISPFSSHLDTQLSSKIPQFNSSSLELCTVIHLIFYFWPWCVWDHGNPGCIMLRDHLQAKLVIIMYHMTPQFMWHACFHACPVVPLLYWTMTAVCLYISFKPLQLVLTYWVIGEKILKRCLSSACNWQQLSPWVQWSMILSTSVTICGLLPDNVQAHSLGKWRYVTEAS